MAFDKDAEWGVLEGQKSPQDCLNSGTRQAGGKDHGLPGDGITTGMKQPTRGRKKPMTTFSSIKQGRG